MCGCWVVAPAEGILVLHVVDCQRGFCPLDKMGTEAHLRGCLDRQVSSKEPFFVATSLSLEGILQARDRL